MANVWCGVWTPFRLRPDGEQEPIGYIEVKWRDLNYQELFAFRSSREHSRIVFTRIYETCLVEGPSLDDVPAGIALWIGRQQIEQNPFNGRFETIMPALAAARERASDWQKIAAAVIAGTFRYTFEEIAAWSPQVFMERLAAAELLTGVPINPSNPDAPVSPKKNSRLAKPKPSVVTEQQSHYTRSSH